MALLDCFILHITLNCLPINTISLNIKGSIIQSKISVLISKVLFIKDKEHRRDITDIDLHWGKGEVIQFLTIRFFFDVVDGHFPRTVNGTKRYSICVSGKNVHFQWKDLLIQSGFFFEDMSQFRRIGH